MQNIVDAIDRLKNACDAEHSLRHLVDVELSRGDNNGPMRKAHDKQVLEVISAAQALIDSVPKLVDF